MGVSNTPYNNSKLIINTDILEVQQLQPRYSEYKSIIYSIQTFKTKTNLCLYFYIR